MCLQVEVRSSRHFKEAVDSLRKVGKEVHTKFPTTPVPDLV